MKDSKSLVLILGLVIITSQLTDVTGSGAYMTAFLRRQSQDGLQFDKIKDLNSLHSSNSTLLQHHLKLFSSLQHLDEKYSTCNGIDIRELTIPQAREFFKSQRLTSLALTNCYLQRISKLNPVLKAVLEVNSNAIEDAHKSDLEMAQGQQKGAMHGIPVLVKDNIAIKDWLQTTSGSWSLYGHVPKYDADVVKMLRKAGAVIIGKANLSEFSAFRGTRVNGWSGRGGGTQSPYKFGTDPQGSSTGSAVGVASNLAMVSVGTETDGSLISPANVAGIFTLKPTLGMTSTTGVIPISKHQDCVGPMARTMTDLAILFDAMVPQKNASSLGYSPHNNNIPNKLRIGVLRYPYWNASLITSKELKYQVPHLERLLHSMKASSHFQVVDPVAAPSDSSLEEISCEKEFIVLTHDFKHEINEYLRYQVTPNISASFPFPRKINTLQDIIQFNRDYPDGLGQALLELSQITDGIYNQTYLEAGESNQQTARKLLSTALFSDKLDALIFPNPVAYDGLFNENPQILSERLADTPLVGYQLAAIAGYPSLSVPEGIDGNGVPFGVTLIGMPNSDSKLLKIGYLMENIYPARQPPKFLL